MFLAGDEISRPVKHYVVETYRKRLAGVFSASLRMAVAGMTPGCADPASLTAAELAAYHGGGLVPNRPLEDALDGLCDSMFKAEVAKYWQTTVDALQACQRTNHLQRTTFQWFHENLLPVDAITSPPIRCVKSHCVLHCFSYSFYFINKIPFLCQSLYPWDNGH